MWLFDRSTAQVIDADNIRALTGGPALIPPGMTAPNAPSDLAVTTAFDTQVGLSWTDNSTNESRFEIQRATNSSSTSNLVTTNVAADTSITSVNGLTGSTTYYFRVWLTVRAKRPMPKRPRPRLVASLGPLCWAASRHANRARRVKGQGGRKGQDVDRITRGLAAEAYWPDPDNSIPSGNWSTSATCVHHNTPFVS